MFRVSQETLNPKCHVFELSKPFPFPCMEKPAIRQTCSAFRLRQALPVEHQTLRFGRACCHWCIMDTSSWNHTSLQFEISDLGSMGRIELETGRQRQRWQYMNQPYALIVFFELTSRLHTEMSTMLLGAFAGPQKGRFPWNVQDGTRSRRRPCRRPMRNFDSECMVHLCRA